MHVGHAAEFPQAGVGLVVERERAFTQRLQPLEHRQVAALLQPVVEEQLRRRQHHRSIDVVLFLQPGEIATADRAHAAVAA